MTYKFVHQPRFMTGLDQTNTGCRWHGVAWAAWGGMGWHGRHGRQVTLLYGQPDRHGLEPNNHHQNPLETVNRYHSDHLDINSISV